MRSAAFCFWAVLAAASAPAAAQQIPGSAEAATGASAIFATTAPGFSAPAAPGAFRIPAIVPTATIVPPAPPAGVAPGVLSGVGPAPAAPGVLSQSLLSGALPSADPNLSPNLSPNASLNGFAFNASNGFAVNAAPPEAFPQSPALGAPMALAPTNQPLVAPIPAPAAAAVLPPALLAIPAAMPTISPPPPAAATQMLEAPAVAALATTAAAARSSAPTPAAPPAAPVERATTTSPKPAPKPTPIAQIVLDRRAAEAFAARKGGMIFSGEKGLRVVEALERAADHGLPQRKYGAEALRRRAAEAAALSPAEAKALDLDIAAAFLVYARDVSTGLVTPRSVDPEIHIDVTRAAPADLLEAAYKAPDLTAYLESLAPRAPEYQRLKGVLSDYLRVSSQGGWGPALPEFGIVRPGETSSAVTMLRQRLIALGDLPPEPELTLMMSNARPGTPLIPTTYDQRLLQGVASFQARHGLQADGVAGPRTLRALNAPIERRIAQIMLNMERLRWRSRPTEKRRVDVNLAGFEVTVYDDDKPVYWSRVAVGQTEDGMQTPEFDNRIDHLVFHPSWNVPHSIASREMLPQVKRNIRYFVDNNFEVTRGGEVVDTLKVDWSKVTQANFSYQVRQKPGPDNALGRVKFMFPNRFNVYLHDTPSRHLFGEDARAFSHGCVRVERPMELAEALLAPQSADPRAEVEKNLANNTEHLVRIRPTTLVRLTYHTAWVDAQGRLQFRDDVYSRDEKLAVALQNAIQDSLTAAAPLRPTL